MIAPLIPQTVTAVFDLYGRSRQLSDQWRTIVARIVARTGLAPDIVEDDLFGEGFAPTDIDLAHEDVCEAIVDGAVRRLDAVEEPRNHCVTLETWCDVASRTAGRIARVGASDDERANAIALISLEHDVDAYVAALAMRHLGPWGAALFIAPTSSTEH